ncbi:hypothetical protein C1H84_01285 [Glutamicibacter soli]|uniref:Uncharacterized protein n=1 Tax=Glutamicibacter soli TaxID=453836 RepID=A0A365YML9_9MICC|nr:hypothetical protein C1H84_01285 [Glutamicibacter soli]
MGQNFKIDFGVVFAQQDWFDRRFRVVCTSCGQRVLDAHDSCIRRALRSWLLCRLGSLDRFGRSGSLVLVGQCLQAQLPAGQRLRIIGRLHGWDMACQRADFFLKAAALTQGFAVTGATQ